MGKRKAIAVVSSAAFASSAWASMAGVPPQSIVLDGAAGGKRFDGIGVVDGGGATSVLLKDYPEPQRSQILDLLYKPNFGASVSALYVEVPGDGNSTQGSMPSHMHSREDLNYWRGYSWWVMREAKRRNRELSLDAAAWSAPGWIGGRGGHFPQARGDKAFFSKDAVDYYLKWLEGLRTHHRLELDALGVRNEKGVSYGFAKAMRAALDGRGFAKVRLHAFDNWPNDWKLAFVDDMAADPALRAAIDVVGAHMNPPEYRVPTAVQRVAAAMGKPIWNTEAHVYKPGFDALIGVVQAFNSGFVHSGVTKTINWYGIAAVYESEPYSGEKEAAVRANWPWSGHYSVNPSLWGYAHYGQFTEVGWRYLNGGSGELGTGGTFVSLASPRGDFSFIAETAGAARSQTINLVVKGGLSSNSLAVWRSDTAAQFVRMPDVIPRGGRATITLDPASVYSITTTRGQRKGNFDGVPAKTAFPSTYADDFEGYGEFARWGYLPRYFADIAGAFELAPCPDRKGGCLRQSVAVQPISWAPNWQPYTIIGDAAWTDYEVSGDVRLASGEGGGLMGRVNNVGTGYGYIPKGYILTLDASGVLRLAVSRGKENKSALVGDAEQQAIIKAGGDSGPGGLKVLGEVSVGETALQPWHRLALRFSGTRIVGSVDGVPLISSDDSTYGHGMVGLLARGDASGWSQPYYDNIRLVPGAGMPIVAEQAQRRVQLYPRSSSQVPR